MISIKVLIINLCLYSLLYTLLMSIILMCTGRNIFTKSHKNIKTLYMPIMNLYTLLEIINISSFYGILFFIPFINIIIISFVSYKLGKKFDMKISFIIGLIFLPIVYYYLLSKSNNKYKADKEESPDAYESVKGDNIYLLTEEELKEHNNLISETSNVDSIFKSEAKIIKEEIPYQAEKKEDKEKIFYEIDESYKPIEKIEMKSEIDETDNSIFKGNFSKEPIIENYKATKNKKDEVLIEMTNDHMTPIKKIDPVKINNDDPSIFKATDEKKKIIDSYKIKDIKKNDNIEFVDL